MTKRQLEVLQLMAEGLTNKQIAVILGISEHTVRNHAVKLFRTMGVPNRVLAIQAARKIGKIIDELGE